MNKLLISLITISSALIAGCGGSSSSTALHTLDGKWTTGCVYDASVNLAEFNIFTINGSSYSRDASVYNTSDCSGSPSNKVVITADIDYVGKQITSTCAAEKTNITYTKIIVDNITLNTQQFNQFLSDIGTSNPEYDIACVSSNRLWIGDKTNGKDASTEDRRPTTINLSISATRI